MADMYSIVKKQDEKIDGLPKIAQKNNDLLTDIDTRMVSAPEQTTTPATSEPQKIQVELPASIATNESVKKLVEAALAKQKVDALKSLDFSQLPKELAEAFAMFFKNGLDESVKKALHTGIHDEFASQTSDLRDAARQLNNRMRSVIDGAVWATIPKWVYVVFAIAVLAAGGFGYGFFHLLNENSKLKDVEWLYRRERTLYKTDKERQLLLNHERDFFMGTAHEQDSIKDVIRYWERKGDFDKTYLYFNPTEK